VMRPVHHPQRRAALRDRLALGHPGAAPAQLPRAFALPLLSPTGTLA
jgi:hypothetical protein